MLRGHPALQRRAGPEVGSLGEPEPAQNMYGRVGPLLSAVSLLDPIPQFFPVATPLSQPQHSLSVHYREDAF